MGKAERASGKREKGQWEKREGPGDFSSLAERPVLHDIENTIEVHLVWEATFPREIGESENKSLCLRHKDWPIKNDFDRPKAALCEEMRTEWFVEGHRPGEEITRKLEDLGFNVNVGSNEQRIDHHRQGLRPMGGRTQ